MYKISKIAVAACALAAATLPAKAADIVPYEPIPAAVPVPAAVLGGWYLRGDIGYSNQEVDELYNVLYDEYDSVESVHKEFTGAPFIGGGIGYKVNNWFRVDATGEYRSKSEFNGADIADFAGTLSPNVYTAKKSEYVALANAYIDLGSWHGISPFIGAGIGAANVNISAFTDTGVTFDSVAFGDEHDEWNLAWAVYAGLGFDVTDNFTMELAYRYLDMGDGASGNLVAYDGTDNFDNPMEFNDITSHDVKLGFRYKFN
jgi:opacity protein-like surface antigen